MRYLFNLCWRLEGGFVYITSIIFLNYLNYLSLIYDKLLTAPMIYWSCALW